MTECGAPKVSQEGDPPPRRQLEPWRQIKRSPVRCGGGLGLGSPSLIPPRTHTNMSDGLVRTGCFFFLAHADSSEPDRFDSSPSGPERACEKKKSAFIGGESSRPSEREGVCRRTLAKLAVGQVRRAAGGPQPCFHSLPRLVSKQGSRRHLLVPRMKVFTSSDPFDSRKNNR